MVRPFSYSPSTAAETTQAVRTVEERHRELRLPLGWWLALYTSHSALSSSLLAILHSPTGVFVRIEVVGSLLRTISTFFTTTAASKKTPRQGRAGSGSPRWEIGR